MKKSEKIDLAAPWVKLFIVRLIKAGVDTRVIAKAAGQPVQAIAAIRAHITMGTYGR